MIAETTISVEDYFTQLAESDVKLEFHDGEVVAMAGAKPKHNIITSNIFGELYACLKSKGCLILTADQLVHVAECKKYVFPDLVIVCQKPIFEASPRGIDALINPEIIIEVLSDSTMAYDRTEKFDCYKTIPSFREYVLVSSDKKQVEVVKKLRKDEWLSRTYTDAKATVTIDECEILLEEIYSKIELTENENSLEG